MGFLREGCESLPGWRYGGRESFQFERKRSTSRRVLGSKQSRTFRGDRPPARRRSSWMLIISSYRSYRRATALKNPMIDGRSLPSSGLPPKMVSIKSLSNGTGNGVLDTGVTCGLEPMFNAMVLSLLTTCSGEVRNGKLTSA